MDILAKGHKRTERTIGVMMRLFIVQTLPRPALPSPTSPRLAQHSHAPPRHVDNATLPCLAKPCRALPCHAVPCRALPRRAAPGRALPCHAVPCHARPCPAQLFPVQPFGCETAIFGTPVADADLLTGDVDPVIEARDIDRCILDIQRDHCGPLWKDGAHPDYASGADTNEAAETESLIGPQFLRRARPVIFQTAGGEAETARCCGSALPGFPGRIDDHAVDDLGWEDRTISVQVKARHKFDPRHFFIVGVGFVSLARNLLDRLAVSVEGVGSLPVVLNQCNGRSQLVTYGVPCHD